MGPVFWIIMVCSLLWMVILPFLWRGNDDAAFGIFLLAGLFSVASIIGIAVIIDKAVEPDRDKSDEYKVVSVSEVPLRSQRDGMILEIVPTYNSEGKVYYYTPQDSSLTFIKESSVEDIQVKFVPEGTSPSLKIEYGVRHPRTFLAFGIHLLPHDTETWEEEASYQHLTFFVPESRVQDMSGSIAEPFKSAP